MEPITVKFEDGFLREIEKFMKKHRYMTKAEFIREAIREKIKQLEKEELLQKVDKIFGSSKRKTTDEQLHAAGEKAIEQLEKKFRVRKSK